MIGVGGKIMFSELKENELLCVNAGGGLVRDIGFFCHCWCDFWEGVGEGCYDALH